MNTKYSAGGQEYYMRCELVVGNNEQIYWRRRGDTKMVIGDGVQWL